MAWTVLKDVASWGFAAHAAARTKTEQRYTRVVEHSAVLVVSVTRLHQELSAIVHPLVFFDHREWNAARRQALVSELVRFTTEETVVPQMRTSRSALRTLLVDMDDMEARASSARILYIADALFHPSAWQQEGAFSRPGAELLDAAGPDAPNVNTLADLVKAAEHEFDDYFSPETAVHQDLPGLLAAIRDADDDERDAGLRRLASQFVTAGPPLPEAPALLDDHVRPPRPVAVLSQLGAAAAEMQHHLGLLLAAAQRAFPSMPSPTWSV